MAASTTLIITLALLLCFCKVSLCSDCSTFPYTAGDKGFIFSDDLDRTQLQAQQYCNEIGARLPEIQDDSGEFEVIRQILTEKATPFWLGLLNLGRANCSNLTECAANTDFEWSYSKTAFGINFPPETSMEITITNSDSEICMALEQLNLITSQSCQTTLATVCVKDCSKSNTTCPGREQSIPNNYIQHGPDNKLYTIHEGLTSYSAAKQTCINDGATLLSLEESEEFRFARYLLESTGTTSSWIGLENLDNIICSNASCRDSGGLFLNHGAVASFSFPSYTDNLFLLEQAQPCLYVESNPEIIQSSDCQTPRAAICKIECNSESELLAQSLAPAGYSVSPNGKLYKLETQFATREAATTKCEENGGKLAAFQSETDAYAMRSIMATTMSDQNAKIWTSLTHAANKTNIPLACDTFGCDGVLAWEGGLITEFSYKEFMGIVLSTTLTSCLSVTSSLSTLTTSCVEQLPFLCEYVCPSSNEPVPPSDWPRAKTMPAGFTQPFFEAWIERRQLDLNSTVNSTDTIVNSNNTVASNTTLSLDAVCNAVCLEACGDEENRRTELCMGQSVSVDDNQIADCRCTRSQIVLVEGAFCGPRGRPCEIMP